MHALAYSSCFGLPEPVSRHSHVKRTNATSHATEQTSGAPADAEATMKDSGYAASLWCRGSATEPNAATEHISPASFGSTCEASPGSDDMSVKSLADVVSKLARVR